MLCSSSLSHVLEENASLKPPSPLVLSPVCRAVSPDPLSQSIPPSSACFTSSNNGSLSTRYTSPYAALQLPCVDHAKAVSDKSMEQSLSMKVCACVRVRPATYAAPVGRTHSLGYVSEVGLSSANSSKSTAFDGGRDPGKSKAAASCKASAADRRDAGPHSNYSRRCIRAYASEAMVDYLGEAGWNPSGRNSYAGSSSEVASAQRFTYDALFDEDSTQEEVMHAVGRPVVERVMEGYNATVLCYGQSGSGKTHSMFGPKGGQIGSGDIVRKGASASGGSPSPPALKPEAAPDGVRTPACEYVFAKSIGLLPRILYSLFERLEGTYPASSGEAHSSNSESVVGGSVLSSHGHSGRRHAKESPMASRADTTAWTVTMSAVEIYNEELRDLMLYPIPAFSPSSATSRPLQDCDSHRTVTTRCGFTGASKETNGEAEDVGGDGGDCPKGEYSPTDSAGGEAGRHALFSPVRLNTLTLSHGLCRDEWTQESPHGDSTHKSCHAQTAREPCVTAAGRRHHNGLAEQRLVPPFSARPPARTRRDKPKRAAVPVLDSHPTLRIVSVSSGADSGKNSANTANVSVMIEGLRLHRVRKFEEAMLAVRQALSQRMLGATKLNASSSRAHTLFFIHVVQRDGEANTVKHTILTLADLAGSERVSHTGAQGIRLKEAQKINLSLALLGNVIRRLSQKQGQRALPSAAAAAAHVPFRDSKLTRLLQDSLGGNAIAFLLCTVSPDCRDALETISTLRFAYLAKEIKKKSILNMHRLHLGMADVGENQRLHKRLLQAHDYVTWLEAQVDRLPLYPMGVESTGSGNDVEDGDNHRSHVEFQCISVRRCSEGSGVDSDNLIAFVDSGLLQGIGRKHRQQQRVARLVWMLLQGTCFNMNDDGMLHSTLRCGDGAEAFTMTEFQLAQKQFMLLKDPHASYKDLVAALGSNPTSRPSCDSVPRAAARSEVNAAAAVAVANIVERERAAGLVEERHGDDLQTLDTAKNTVLLSTSTPPLNQSQSKLFGIFHTLSRLLLWSFSFFFPLRTCADRDNEYTSEKKWCCDPKQNQAPLFQDASPAAQDPEVAPPLTSSHCHDFSCLSINADVIFEGEVSKDAMAKNDLGRGPSPEYYGLKLLSYRDGEALKKKFSGKCCASTRNSFPFGNSGNKNMLKHLKDGLQLAAAIAYTDDAKASLEMEA